MWSRPRRLVLCIPFALACASAPAQTLQNISYAEHLARIPQLRTTVESCRQPAAPCPAGNIADESFALPNGVQSHVSYAWLRNSLEKIAKAKPEDRAKLTAPLLERLNAPDAIAPAAVPEATARTRADRVLSQVEFAKAKPNIFKQQWERFFDWLGRHLAVSSQSREVASWVRLLLEAALFGVPLLLLGLWLLRQVREDRLRPGLLPAEGAPGQTRTESWGDVAQRHARKGEWREAVHALYWQSVTRLEQRRVWSAARHRTPREYLRLLEAGSQRRNLLRELTVLLERVWYGHTSATETDFERAAQLTREISNA